MLAKRIIPTLLRDGDRLVKGEKFNGWRSVGHARQAVRIMAQRGVDEMVLLDITATAQNRRPDPDKIREYADECFMPLTVGGGIRSIEDVKTCLNAGADKVLIGAAGIPAIKAVAQMYGSQAVSAAIDYFFWEDHEDIQLVRYIMEGGQSFVRNDGPVDYAKKLATAGAGEIILTSIDREGTMLGYDLETIKAVSEAVDIPVIAHGGCSGYEDMLNAIKAGASAVAAGALFQFTDCTPRGAALYLAEHGIEVRL